MPFQSTLKAGNNTEVDVVGVGCFASKFWIATRTSGVVGAWSRCISMCPLRRMRRSWRWVGTWLLMLTAAIALIHQAALLTFCIIIVLAFHKQSRICQGLQVSERHGYQHILHLIMQAINKTFHLLLFYVSVFRGIPRQLKELVAVLTDRHGTLSKFAKFIFLALNHPSGNISLAELDLELIPINSLSWRLHSLDTLQP